ncbi:MAG: hypothetical protein BWY83_02364 [bacterium ADurb.Bin478]|nr:MAG: hypothetical protein BWY83_02364 [bacterium ADurb.Bin478]
MNGHGRIVAVLCCAFATQVAVSGDLHFSQAISSENKSPRCCSLGRQASMGSFFLPWLVYQVKSKIHSSSPDQSIPIAAAGMVNPSAVHAIPGPASAQSASAMSSEQTAGSRLLVHSHSDPFHNKTYWSWYLAQEGLVRITVFDAAGKKMTGPLLKHKSPGRHHIMWDAGQSPNGVYVCLIETREKSARIKFPLVR